MQAAIANCHCIANTGLLITQISMIMGYKRRKWRFTGFEYKCDFRDFDKMCSRKKRKCAKFHIHISKTEADGHDLIVTGRHTGHFIGSLSLPSGCYKIRGKYSLFMT